MWMSEELSDIYVFCVWACRLPPCWQPVWHGTQYLPAGELTTTQVVDLLSNNSFLPENHVEKQTKQA